MIETLLIFRLGDTLLGLDSDRVTRVQRVPAMTGVPLGEGALRGIAVIDGRIVPVLDMGLLLAQAPVAQQSEAARLVVVQFEGDSLGFLVDGIEQTVALDGAALAPTDSDLKGVVGVFDLEGTPVQVIRPEALLDAPLLGTHAPFHVPFPLPQPGAQTEPEQGAAGTDGALYLHFMLGDEHFAISTDQVRELLKVPARFTPLSGAPMPPVLGVSPLRGEMVSVLDLSELLGFGAFEATAAQGRLVVIGDGQRQLALAVPRVHEVIEVSGERIQPVRAGEAEQPALPVSGVFQLADGAVVSVLGEAALAQLLDRFALTETRTHSEQTRQKEEAEMAELAVFRIGQEAYALDIEQVQEIIKLQPITPIPEPPAFVEGIINLRGRVIPVINLPERLGFTFEPGERSKIVVGLHEGAQVGFLVDEVDEILYVDEAACAFSDDADSLIHATVTLDEGRRVILWLRLQKVLEGIRFGALSA